jgi:hypothetical protein
MKEERKIKMEGGLLKTAYTLQMNASIGVITYLDQLLDGSAAQPNC